MSVNDSEMLINRCIWKLDQNYYKYKILIKKEMIKLLLLKYIYIKILTQRKIGGAKVVPLQSYWVQFMEEFCF